LDNKDKIKLFDKMVGSTFKIIDESKVDDDFKVLLKGTVVVLWLFQWMS
jgi:hypothetical protein